MRKKSYSLMVLTCGLIMVSALAACTWQGMHADSDIQTRKLFIVGDFQQIDDELVARRAQAFLNASFFDVDIDGINEAVATIPWVDSVSAYRRWPDAVVIRLTERKPVARWADAQLLAEDGELFSPRSVSGFSQLPHLNGPTGSGLKVLAQWKVLRPEMQKAGLELKALEQDPRGGWHALLDDGLELRLGDADISGRLNRLTSNLTDQLRTQLRSAAYVDLRYSDGFAVGGDRPVAQSQGNRNAGMDEQA